MKCGLDDVCTTDLRLSCSFVDLPKEGDDYVMEATGGLQSLELLLEIENKLEKAYETLLFVEYENKTFDPPALVRLEVDSYVYYVLLGASSLAHGELHNYNGTWLTLPSYCRFEHDETPTYVLM